MMGDKSLKQTIASYWNNEACGTNASTATKYSKEYFDEIEAYRYRVEPEIFSFAQFTRYCNQKVLEVGIGAGTDFIQWVRAGVKAFGIDLTEEAIEHTIHRLNVFGLTAMDVRVADAENLPYEDEYFDLVYSFGVIHHSPNTVEALSEIIRVTRPGGSIKVMVYNRNSLVAFYKYMQYGLLRAKPFRSIQDILYHHQESPGTKAFTMSELKKILSSFPVEIVQMNAKATNYDLLWGSPKIFRAGAYLLACLFGFQKCGWFLTMELIKKNSKQQTFNP